VALIKGWEPPLVLRFRRAPLKKGVLTKEARGKSGKLSAGTWKARHFVLSHGTLQVGGWLRGAGSERLAPRGHPPEDPPPVSLRVTACYSRVTPVSLPCHSRVKTHGRLPADARAFSG
jgi:hypothetical protein